MALWIRLGVSLLFAFVLLGCGKAGGPPSDANDWTCSDWSNAGLNGPNGLNDNGARALTQLGNETDEASNVPGSVSSKKDRLTFYIAKLCEKNPTARPGALAVSKTRRSLLNANADKHPPPLDQSGSGSSSGTGSSSGGSSAPSSSGQSGSGGSTGSGESTTPAPDNTTTTTPNDDGSSGQAPQDTPCRRENPSPPPECFQHPSQ